MEDIYKDIDNLFQTIWDRLNAQSGIIIALTKLRVIKIFIDQIAQGGNKVFLTDRYNEIKKKINNLPKEEAQD